MKVKVKVSELVDALKLEMVAGKASADSEVRWGYVSDLLSDVMGNSREGDLWITMQTHLNVVAVAALRDHAGVLFVAGNRPGPEVIEKADQEGVPLLCTGEPAFDIAGKLFLLLSQER